VTTVVNFLLQKEPYLPDMDFFKRAGEENSYIDFAYHAIVHQDHHVEGDRGTRRRGDSILQDLLQLVQERLPELGIDHSDAGGVYKVLDRVSDIPGGVVMFHAERGTSQSSAERNCRRRGATTSRPGPSPHRTSARRCRSNRSVDSRSTPTLGRTSST